MSFTVTPKNVSSGIVVAEAPRRKKRGAKSYLALNMVPKVTQMSSAEEIKYLSFLASNNASVSSVGTIVNCFAVPQNVGAQGRTGDEVGLLGWEVNLSVHASSSDADGTAVRIIFFRWEIDNALSAPTVSEILESSTVVYAPELMYFQQSVRAGEFTVIFDKTYGVAGNGPVIAVDRLKGSLPSLLTRFTPGTTTAKGAIYMLLISGKAATTPTVCAYTRVYFEDK